MTSFISDFATGWKEAAEEASESDNDSEEEERLWKAALTEEERCYALYGD